MLIKGGHLSAGEVVDLFYDGEEFTTYTHPRLDGQSWHGTGCALSAAITAGLAQGKALTEAVATAIDYIKTSLHQSLNLGQGSRLLCHQHI